MELVSTPSPWIGTILAVIALVQPWLLWLWRKFFKRGRIEIFRTGNIEIGYSNYGPTIGLQGTLQGRDRELFIQAMSVDVTREADQSRHRFEWTMFRSFSVVSTRPNEMQMMLPAGFLLRPAQPFRYNLLLNDVAFQRDHVQPVIETLRAAWIAAVGQALGGAALAANPQVAQAQVQHAAEAAYPGFFAQPAHVTATTELNQQFYWHPGWYALTMQISTAHPTRTITRCWRFELPLAQSQALRLNALKVVQEVCEQYIGGYYFSYVPYNDAP